MDFEKILNDLSQGNETTILVVQVFVIVFVTLLIDFIQKRVVNRMQARIEKSRIHWDDALYFAVRRPLSFLIWLLGLSLAASLVAKSTDAAVFELITPTREVGVIAILAWALVRFILGMEKGVVQRAEQRGDDIDRTTVDAIGKLLRLSVVITAVLIAMQTLGFSISGILAFGGVGGIAIGFAAKDLLSNFFGGLMIFLDRPFAVGDWIRSPDRDIEGTVEKIGWRLTVIRTFDKRPLYLPNSAFASIAVENPSRMSHRRIYETIGLRYDDAAKAESIIKAVKEMLLNHPEIDTSQTMIVNLNAFAASSIDFFIYTFTKTTNWVFYHEVKQDVLLKVMQIIDEHDAEMAYPTSTVHLAEGGLPLEQSKQEQ